MKPDKSEDKKPPAPRKVFDVMRPGKAPASPTSRPIIGGHKNKVQDSVSGVGGVGEGRPLGKHKKIELAHDADAPAKDAPENEKEKASASPAPAIETSKPAVSAPEPAKPDEAAPALAAVIPEEMFEKKEAKPTPLPPAETPASADDSMEVRLPAEGPMPPAPELEAAKDDTPAPIPNQEDIIVGHHGAIDAPGQALLLLGLIIVLALVAVNILLDADILKIDGIPHTNLFK